MNRRGFLADTAADARARPALAGKSQTLVCVPRNVLNSIDPIWTTT